MKTGLGCHVCGSRPSDGVALFRVGAYEDHEGPDAIAWCCKEHLPADYMEKADKGMIDLISILLGDK